MKLFWKKEFALAAQRESSTEKNVICEMQITTMPFCIRLMRDRNYFIRVSSRDNQQTCILQVTLVREIRIEKQRHEALLDDSWRDRKDLQACQIKRD